jgi:DNA-binding MarR family transcriptional regulator
MKSQVLENHLCFKLYALSRQITQLYRPMLDAIELTYPQYLVMVVLWTTPELYVKDLGERLYLDSGTLTPLLKRLEQKQLLTRNRCKEDERLVMISITPRGEALKEKATAIPGAVNKECRFKSADYIQLQQQLDQILATLKHTNELNETI